MVARITCLLKTKCIPACKLRQVFCSSRFSRAGARGIGNTRRKKRNEQMASMMYTQEKLMCATMIPLIAGQETEPIENTMLFKVTALAKASHATRVGKYEIKAVEE